MYTAETYLRGNMVLSHLVTYKQSILLVFVRTVAAAFCTSQRMFGSLLRKACVKTIAVVNLDGDKGMDEFF